MQAVCRPSSLEKVPALQLTHDVAPAVDVYLPTGQVVHQEDLATEKVPAVQLSQADPLQLVPASQLHLAWVKSIDPPRLLVNMSVITTLVFRSQQSTFQQEERKIIRVWSATRDLYIIAVSTLRISLRVLAYLIESFARFECRLNTGRAREFPTRNVLVEGFRFFKDTLNRSC